MKTRLLTTTALALGLLLPATAMSQQSSGDSPAKPNMTNQGSQSTPGTAASGTSNRDTTGATSSSSGTGSAASSTTTPRTGATTGATGTTGSTTTMSALDKTVVGKSLYGANDEEVGEIDDVVMSQGGEVESVLIDVGGFLGLGSKTIAIPADDISMQGDKVVASTLTKEQAEQMPEYQKN